MVVDLVYEVRIVCMLDELLASDSFKLLGLYARIKISVNTDISVIGFYKNIGKISVDIFTKISLQLKFFIF